MGNPHHPFTIPADEDEPPSLPNGWLLERDALLCSFCSGSGQAFSGPVEGRCSVCLGSGEIGAHDKAWRLQCPDGKVAPLETLGLITDEECFERVKDARETGARLLAGLLVGWLVIKTRTWLELPPVDPLATQMRLVAGALLEEFGLAIDSHMGLAKGRREV